MKLLNLGCGYRYHRDWVNVDFVSTGEGVIAHNLLQGIPFADCRFDVVYHSHVLEHFPKEKAPDFIGECFRVLKPGGVIRVVVPDLEQVVREYLKNLEGALANDPMAAHNYDWIMIELFDQIVRTRSGGAYGEYWWRDDIPNPTYLVKRMGEEYLTSRRLYDEYRKLQANPDNGRAASTAGGTDASSLPDLSNKPTGWLGRVKKALFTQEHRELNRLRKELQQKLSSEAEFIRVGRFRASGEIHQWMYDRYSLGRLLLQTGFTDYTIHNAYTSQMPNWSMYALDTEHGQVRKPDSMFVEAMKPL